MVGPPSACAGKSALGTGRLTEFGDEEFEAAWLQPLLPFLPVLPLPAPLPFAALWFFLPAPAGANEQLLASWPVPPHVVQAWMHPAWCLLEKGPLDPAASMSEQVAFMKPLQISQPPHFLLA